MMCAYFRYNKTYNVYAVSKRIALDPESCLMSGMKRCFPDNLFIFLIKNFESDMCCESTTIELQKLYYLW